MKCYRCNSWPCSCGDGITLIHGDCREVLPQLPRASLLMTDPPYGIGADQKQANRAGKRHGNAAVASRDYGASDWDSTTPPAWMFGLMLDRSEWVAIWGGNYFDLPQSPCWLVWDKDNGDNGYADCELAWTNLPKAIRKFEYRWMGMLQEHAGDRKETRFHPTQKPLPLMKWAIALFPDNCELVVDPYCGSGTTLIAAKELGRRAIGIEANEDYASIAANRLRQSVLQFTD